MPDEYKLITKYMRRRVFLKEMNLVVAWTDLIELIQPHRSPKPTDKGGNVANNLIDKT